MKAITTRTVIGTWGELSESSHHHHMLGNAVWKALVIYNHASVDALSAMHYFVIAQYLAGRYDIGFLKNARVVVT